MLTCVLAFCSVTRVVAFLARRSVERPTSRSACSRFALAPASSPSTCLACASMARLSSVNNRSPLWTIAPSRKCTSVISVSTRAFTATLAIGVTDPRTSIRTGTDLLTACVTSTGTAGAAFSRCACATAPPDQNPPRMATTIAAAARTAAPPKSNAAFLINGSGRLSGHAVRVAFLSCSLHHIWYTRPAVLSYSAERYISEHGYSPKNSVTIGTRRIVPPRHRTFAHAHRNLERQLHQAKNGPAGCLDHRAIAGYRVPAGDQMCRRGVSARAPRKPRL